MSQFDNVTVYLFSNISREFICVLFSDIVVCMHILFLLFIDVCCTPHPGETLSHHTMNVYIGADDTLNINMGVVSGPVRWDAFLFPVRHFKPLESGMFCT